MSKTMPAAKPQILASNGARAGSIYGHLREQLRETLIDGAKVGDRVPAERELARRFGVSPVTVSRSLQELQREGLIERIPGKGTFICAVTPAAPSNRVEAKRANFNPVAGSADAENLDPFAWARNGGGIHHNQTSVALPDELEQANLWIISLWKELSLQPEAHQYWSHRVTSSAERWVQRIAGNTTITNRAQIEASQIKTTIAQMLREGINAIIFVGDNNSAQGHSALWQRHLLQAWEERSQKSGAERRAAVPFGLVQILFNPLTSWACDAVRFDGETGVYEATSYLLKLGHRQIALALPAASQEAEFVWLQERIRGFDRALQSALPDDVEAVDLSRHIVRSQPQKSGTAYWSNAGTDVGKKLLEQKQFTAVVAVNDHMARTVIEEVRAAGRSVPDDLSVIGFDDTLEASQLGLTTVHAPIEQMGAAAASLAVQRLNFPHKEGRNELILKPSLMVRATTRPLSK